MPLAFVLAIAAAIGYAVLWSLLPGSTGCGPPGHSTSGRIFSAAPFAFPVVATVAVLLVAMALRWRRRAAVEAVIATVVTSSLLEIAVLLLQFGSHHCGE
jgi:hypothetical protein